MFLDMHGLIFHLSISPLAGSTRHLADREASTPKRVPKARPEILGAIGSTGNIQETIRGESSDTQCCQLCIALSLSQNPRTRRIKSVFIRLRILFTSQSSFRSRRNANNRIAEQTSEQVEQLPPTLHSIADPFTQPSDGLLPTEIESVMYYCTDMLRCCWICGCGDMLRCKIKPSSQFLYVNEVHNRHNSRLLHMCAGRMA